MAVKKTEEQPKTMQLATEKWEFLLPDCSNPPWERLIVEDGTRVASVGAGTRSSWEDDLQ